MSPEYELNTDRMIEDWAKEDRRLQGFSDDIRIWMESQKFDDMVLGEVVKRWNDYRQMVKQHFDGEDRLLESLHLRTKETQDIVDAVIRQSSRDHSQILTRIDKLIAGLSNSNLAPAWEEVLLESNLLFDAVEQHEEQELDSLKVLTCSLEQPRS